MKVFHYTKLEHYQDIVRGSYKSKNKPGLGSSHRMGHKYMEAWETSAVFALLEPSPANWMQNPYFKDIFNYLDLGPLLLEIETDPKKDNAFVVDRGHVEGFLYEDKTGIPKKYLHPSLSTAERAYMQSKIPLRDYLA